MIEDFIEGIACPVDCAGSPSCYKEPAEINKTREKLPDSADNSVSFT